MLFCSRESVGRCFMQDENKKNLNINKEKNVNLYVIW